MTKPPTLPVTVVDIDSMNPPDEQVAALRDFLRATRCDDWGLLDMLASDHMKAAGWETADEEAWGAVWKETERYIGTLFRAPDWRKGEYLGFDDDGVLDVSIRRGELTPEEVDSLLWRQSVDDRYWVGHNGGFGPYYVADEDPEEWLERIDAEAEDEDEEEEEEGMDEEAEEEEEEEEEDEEEEEND